MNLGTIIKVVFWPPFFVWREVVFAAIVLVSVPAIRSPQQPLLGGPLKGVGVDNLPNHVELSTVPHAPVHCMAYWCGQRIAVSFSYL